MQKGKEVIVKYLTKSGCCLCDRGLYIIKRIKRRYDLDNIEVVDIACYPQYTKYKNSVPVVLINEEIVSCMKLEERKISQFLEKTLNNKT